MSFVATYVYVPYLSGLGKEKLPHLVWTREKGPLRSAAAAGITLAGPLPQQGLTDNKLWQRKISPELNLSATPFALFHAGVYH